MHRLMGRKSQEVSPTGIQSMHLCSSMSLRWKAWCWWKEHVWIHLENNRTSRKQHKGFFFLCATKHVYVHIYSFSIPLSNVLTLPASNVQLTLGFFLLLPPPPPLFHMCLWAPNKRRADMVGITSQKQPPHKRRHNLAAVTPRGGLCLFSSQPDLSVLPPTDCTPLHRWQSGTFQHRSDCRPIANNNHIRSSRARWNSQSSQFTGMLLV